MPCFSGSLTMAVPWARRVPSRVMNPCRSRLHGVQVGHLLARQPGQAGVQLGQPVHHVGQPPVQDLPGDLHLGPGVAVAQALGHAHRLVVDRAAALAPVPPAPVAPAAFALLQPVLHQGAQQVKELIDRLARPLQPRVDLGDLLLDGLLGGVRHRAVHKVRRHGAQEAAGPGLAAASHAAVGRAQLLQEHEHVALVGRKAQLVGGHVLQVVRLVDDQVLVLGQDAVLRGQVRDQQGVVDHHDVRRLGLAPGPVEVALVAAEVHAVVRLARLGLGRDLAPGGVLRGHGDGQLAALAGERGGQPHQHLGGQPQLVHAKIAALPEGHPAAQAEVVGAALDQGRAELERRAPSPGWARTACRSGMSLP